MTKYSPVVCTCELAAGKLGRSWAPKMV